MFDQLVGNDKVDDATTLDYLPGSGRSRLSTISRLLRIRRILPEITGLLSRGGCGRPGRGCRCGPQFQGGIPVHLRGERFPLVGVTHDPRQAVAPEPVPQGLVALRGLHAWRGELAEADLSPNRAVSEIARTEEDSTRLPTGGHGRIPCMISREPPGLLQTCGFAADNRQRP